jgi:hypothetical protein
MIKITRERTFAGGAGFGDTISLGEDDERWLVDTGQAEYVEAPPVSPEAEEVPVSPEAEEVPASPEAEEVPASPEAEEPPREADGGGGGGHRDADVQGAGTTGRGKRRRVV